MKKWLLVAAAGVVLVGAGLVAYGLYRKHQGRDIHGSPTQEFNTTETKATPIKPTAKIRWPMYRFDAARQGAPEGVLQAVVPPFRPLWFFRPGSLVEFPPAIAYGKLYFANAQATLFAVDGKHVRTAAARAERHVLLDAGGRLRPRLHRGDRREDVLVRGDEREAALVARDRRLRLRLAGRLEPARVRGLVPPVTAADVVSAWSI